MSLISLTPELVSLINEAPFNEIFIKISFKLGICLHLDESNLFSVNGKNGELIGIIYCEDIKEGSSEFGTGTNVELKSDIKGAFRFTNINLVMPNRSKTREITVEIERNVLYATNKFLDSYKLVTRRFGIENIFSLSGLRDYNTQFFFPQEPTHGIYRMQFPEGITKLLPLRSIDDVKKINELVSQEEDLDLVEQFFLDARKFLAREYNLAALVNAVTSLQLKYKKFLSSLDFNKYSLSAKELKILKNKEELPQKIDIIFSKILKESDLDDILDSAKNAIRERNDIVHDGKRKIDGDVNKYLDSLEKVIGRLVVKK